MSFSQIVADLRSGHLDPTDITVWVDNDAVSVKDRDGSDIIDFDGGPEDALIEVFAALGVETQRV
jgi:hypothetical protein